jgi:hypothetical protein
MLEGNLAVLRVPHIKEKCPLSRGRLLQARVLKSQEKEKHGWHLIVFLRNSFM